jgi:hypothetical protein
MQGRSASRGGLHGSGLADGASKRGQHKRLMNEAGELYSPAAAERLRKREECPKILRNNCSGKHAGMLALALHLGANIAGDGYNVRPPHHAPANFAEEMRAAYERIVSAMTAYPEMLGGMTESLDIALMRIVPGGLIAKAGAEGLFTGGGGPCEKWPRRLGLHSRSNSAAAHRAASRPPSLCFASATPAADATGSTRPGRSACRVHLADRANCAFSARSIRPFPPVSSDWGRYILSPPFTPGSISLSAFPALAPPVLGANLSGLSSSAISYPFCSRRFIKQRDVQNAISVWSSSCCCSSNLCQYHLEGRAP